MKTKQLRSIKWWLTINVIFACVVGCKSNKTTPTAPNESTTIEHPQPASENKTDSLKKVLDKQREEKLKSKER
jgi:hypothetical protein